MHVDISKSLNGDHNLNHHYDVIKWKHLPRHWPFVLGIRRSPVNFPHKGQWRGALMFSLICAWINCWVNNREAGDLRRHRAHYYATVMMKLPTPQDRSRDKGRNKMVDILWKTLLNNILEWKWLYLLQISLRYVPWGSRHNKLAMVQIISVP